MLLQETWGLMKLATSKTSKLQWHSHKCHLCSFQGFVVLLTFSASWKQELTKSLWRKRLCRSLQSRNLQLTHGSDFFCPSDFKQEQSALFLLNKKAKNIQKAALRNQFNLQSQCVLLPWTCKDMSNISELPFSDFFFFSMFGKRFSCPAPKRKLFLLLTLRRLCLKSWGQELKDTRTT